MDKSGTLPSLVLNGIIASLSIYTAYTTLFVVDNSSADFMFASIGLLILFLTDLPLLKIPFRGSLFLRNPAFIAVSIYVVSFLLVTGFEDMETVLPLAALTLTILIKKVQDRSYETSSTDGVSNLFHVTLLAIVLFLAFFIDHLFQLFPEYIRAAQDTAEHLPQNTTFTFPQDSTIHLLALEYFLYILLLPLIRKLPFLRALDSTH
jgi:hypothetical protein